MPKGKKYTIDGHNADLWNEVGDESLLEDDNESALTAYLQAARLGHVEAMNSVATCYSEKDDITNSLLWSRRAAAFGNEEAIDSLDGTYDPAWHDEFVDAIRTNGFFGEIDSADTTAVEAAPAAPTTYATAVAASAPAEAASGTNATTYPAATAYPDDVDATMASHLAGITFGGGSSGITS